MEKKIFLKFLEGGFGILDLRGKIVNSGFERLEVEIRRSFRVEKIF